MRGKERVLASSLHRRIIPQGRQLFGDAKSFSHTTWCRGAAGDDKDEGVMSVMWETCAASMQSGMHTHNAINHAITAMLSGIEARRPTLYGIFGRIGGAGEASPSPRPRLSIPNIWRVQGKGRLGLYQADCYDRCTLKSAWLPKWTARLPTWFRE